MDRNPEIVIQAVNLGRRLAITDQNEFGDIRCFGYYDGNDFVECDLNEDAIIAVVEWRTGGWSTLLLSDYATDTPVH